MIDMRYWFIYELTYVRPTHEFQRSVPKFKHRDGTEVTPWKHPSAIGETLMGVECAGDQIGREGCDNAPRAVTCDQRPVDKPVAVVIHVVAQKEECAVFRVADTCVPLRFVGWSVLAYL